MNDNEDDGPTIMHAGTDDSALLQHLQDTLAAAVGQALRPFMGRGKGKVAAFRLVGLIDYGDESFRSVGTTVLDGSLHGFERGVVGALDDIYVKAFLMENLNGEFKPLDPGLKN